MKLYNAIVNNASIITKAGIYGVPHYASLQPSAALRQKRINDLLPSGSGFDNGTKIESANDSKIVFSTAFHHMDDNGFYCGWTEHKVIITASLQHGFTVGCTGRDKRSIKEYIENVFAEILETEFDWVEK